MANNGLRSLWDYRDRPLEVTLAEHEADACTARRMAELRNVSPETGLRAAYRTDLEATLASGGSVRPTPAEIVERALASLAKPEVGRMVGGPLAGAFSTSPPINWVEQWAKMAEATPASPAKPDSPLSVALGRAMAQDRQAIGLYCP